jgi:RNA polymerase sigma-70 factor (ECF subfamily)
MDMPTTERFTDTAEQRELLAAAGDGDEQAFGRLVEPYRRTLEIHCYRMLGSAHDAEDTVQETLLRAWRGLARFDRRASVHTWLYRIATNACLDELRRRPRRPEPIQPFPDERVEEAASPVYDPAARYAQREGMELALLSAIQHLPGRQRAVLILRDVLGWTAPEAAGLLDSTVAGVNSALQRARATIDALLPEQAPPAAAATERELLRRYIDVWERDDVDGLLALVREDAVLRMPPRPSVEGAGPIAAFFRARAGGELTGIALAPTRANGRPAVAMHRRGDAGTFEPHGILVLEVSGGAIAGFDAFIDPALPSLFPARSVPPVLGPVPARPDPVPSR